MRVFLQLGQRLNGLPLIGPELLYGPRPLRWQVQRAPFQRSDQALNPAQQVLPIKGYGVFIHQYVQLQLAERIAPSGPTHGGEVVHQSLLSIR